MTEETPSVPITESHKGKKRKLEEEDETTSLPTAVSKRQRKRQRRRNRTSEAQSLGNVPAEGGIDSTKKQREDNQNDPRKAGVNVIEEQKKEKQSSPGKTGLDGMKKKRKKQKRRRKSHRQSLRTQEQAGKVDSDPRPDRRSEEDNIHSLQLSRPQWTLSEPMAGRFLGRDAVFVRDADGNECLVAANSRQVSILSLDTSLPIQSHAAPVNRSICDYTLDAANPDIVQIVYDNNTVDSWDWINGESSPHQLFQVGTTKLEIMGMNSGCVAHDTSSLFYITRRDDLYAVHCEQNMLFETKWPLHSIGILGAAEYIIAHGPSAVVLGKKTERKGGTEYTWVEVPLSLPLTCCNARLLSPSAGTKKKNASQSTGLSLALGNRRGQIYLYDDISATFAAGSRTSLPAPRILHWHREAVASVKFSRDGNYLISGGKETVLVIWQLQTGAKQFLPHLTSAIERIVVNPRGDRYAVHMGDNSIMVLSTSELKPVANFAGLQTASWTDTRRAPHTPTPAAILHSQNPNYILLTVPASQPQEATDIKARPFLQTFDIRTSRHVTRQALTRNNVTDFNISPEEHLILPPDVNLVAISKDGKWLASVDDWIPPISDLEHLGSDEAELEMERQARREVYLKFWSWDKDQGLWTLTTRVDAPHSSADSDSPKGGRISALVSDPASNGFVTIGEDNCVKIWRPKTRMRHGVPLKDGGHDNLIEYVCRRAVHLPRDQQRSDSPLETTDTAQTKTAALAFSTDGSMLAVAQNRPGLGEPPMVYFVETAFGTIKSVRSALADSRIFALGFLEQYFIAVTRKAVYVWDLINNSLMYKLKLAATDQAPRLAVNHDDGTFAVVSTAVAKVQIYAPGHSHCLFEEKLGTDVETLLAQPGTRGYVLLFADATIRTLVPQRGSRLPPPSEMKAVLPMDASTKAETDALAADADAEEDRVATNVLISTALSDETPARVLDESEDDRPVVRPEQLAEIFDVGQSFALPPVKDMLQAIVGLFGRPRRPETSANVAV